jgi:FtsH-binding integral membrane protein
MNEISYSKSENNFINKTLLYMSIGLIITFAVSYFISTNISMMMVIYSNPTLFIGIIIAELALVVVLSRKINKLSAQAAFAMFIAYSIINGLTFGSIFVIYSLQSIISIFVVTAAMFFCCGMIGMTAKKDLSMIGRIAIMGVVGILITSLFNIFIGSGQLSIMINYLGIAVFCALTAYDMQKVKLIHEKNYSYDADTTNKFAIIAALELYLDFINLFIHLISILGKKK